MRIVICILIIALFSCKKNEWKHQWDKDKASLKQVVELLKSDKLKKVYGRSGYHIPDSFNLAVPYSNLAIRQTDFTYDNTFSIIFYLEPIESRNVTSPAFIYTNNQKRIVEYGKNLSMTKKLEDNWYYSYGDGH